MFRKLDAYNLYLGLQFLTGFGFSMIFVVAALISLSSVRAAITMAGLLLAPALPLIGRANHLWVVSEPASVIDES